MSWRCYLLSLLRIHSPNCEGCNAREKYGVEMRKRLEELGWRMQPHSHLEVFDSKPSEVVAGLTISFESQKRKEIA